MVSVPALVMGFDGLPMSPVPAITLVTPAPELTVAQARAVPFHCSTWPLPQELSPAQVRRPEGGVAISPLPAAVLAAVIVPPPKAPL